jgi:ABC-type amino acid transport substrate-binding protein
MKHILFALILIVLALSPATTRAEESSFERVIQTKTINCGYFLWPPYIAKDANTGKLSGINYEIMEAIGKNLDLKINWVAEVGVGDVATALNTNKFDVMCASVWPSPVRMQNLTLSVPTFYSVAYAFARADDHRFDGNLNKANDKSVKVSGIDGDYSHDLSTEKLPLATQAMLPQTASGSEILLQVATKKADIVFSDAGMVAEFLQTNPGSLKQIPGVGAVRYYGETIAVKRGEYQLKNMLDASIMQLTNDGVITQKVEQYKKAYKTEMYAPSRSFEK